MKYDYIYVIKEECEDSTKCRVHGAYSDFDTAIDALKKLIEISYDFNEDSCIDYEKGVAYSDPEYSSDSYINYEVIKLPIIKTKGSVLNN